MVHEGGLMRRNLDPKMKDGFTSFGNADTLSTNWEMEEAMSGDTDRFIGRRWPEDEEVSTQWLYFLGKMPHRVIH